MRALVGAARCVNAVFVCMIGNSIIATVYNGCRRILLDIDGGSSDKLSTSLLQKPPCWLARQYPTIYARTNRYKNSLIVYGLNYWQ